MLPLEWPFRLDHITCDGEEFPFDDPHSKLTGVGIITNEHLQGIQTSICANLHNPTTIIEFSPHREPIRTDSTLLIYDLHPPCREFRKHTWHHYCHNCDNVHALLFYGLGRANLQEKLQERIKADEFTSKYPLNTEAMIRVGEITDRPYLEYDCPLLGYRELLFPIFFEGQVVATFFVGELSLEGKIDFIRRRQEQFFATNPDCFDPYCNGNPECTPEDIREIVMAKNECWVAELSNVLSAAKCRELVALAHHELEQFERTLIDQMDLRRDRYARSRVAQRIQDFQKRLSTESVEDGESLDRLWSNLQARLNDFIEDFAFEYAIVFGTRQPSREDVDLLEVVAYAGVLPSDLASAIDSLRFDLGVMPLSTAPGPISSVENPRLHDGAKSFSESLKPGTYVINLLPVPFQPQNSVVILVRYHDRDWYSLRENQSRLEGYLFRSMQSFYAVVLTALSATFADIAQNNMEDSLRIFGHELGQITAGLDWLREAYLADPRSLRNLREKKAEDICRDIEGYSKQLHFITETAKIVVAPPQLEKEEFLAFRELLYKWQDIYRLEADRKDLQFELHQPETLDPERPPVYGDLMYLEQLVYNLVNNAVKYSHRGTKIRLDCRKLAVHAVSPHILTVTNYGPAIEPGDHPYGLFVRGRETTHKEGLGIGLYVAKRIAEAHGGSIEHSCNEISKFNVPLLVPYLENHLGSTGLISGVEDELNRLRAAGYLEKAIAMGSSNRQRYSNPSAVELLKSIRKPTYEVTFTVTIPSRRQQR